MNTSPSTASREEAEKIVREFEAGGRRIVDDDVLTDAIASSLEALRRDYAWLIQRAAVDLTNQRNIYTAALTAERAKRKEAEFELVNLKTASVEARKTIDRLCEQIPRGASAGSAPDPVSPKQEEMS